jgi:hypothetical protein
MRAIFCTICLCIALLLIDSNGLPLSAQQPPINQFTIGKMELTGDFWNVLNLQGALPAHRTELRLFPKSGTTTDQPIGGEVTISADDLNNIPASGDYHVMAMYAYNQEYRLQSQAGGTATPYPIKFDSMGGFVNFSLNTDGSLGISRGISNTEGAGGFSHQRMPACLGPSCTSQLTWQTSFGDKNYTATCTLGGAIGVVNWTQKEQNFMIVTVSHLAGSTGGEIDCVGIHD